jgi:acyl-CoA synthetase (AMP-forming)/AMP-acid ligase II
MTTNSSPLLSAWEKTLRRCGGQRAIVQAADGRGVTFRELDAAARTWLSRHAPARDALAGRAVVFALPNGIRWFEVFIGLMHAGAVAVPLDANEPVVAQQRTAEALRAGCWLAGENFVSLSRARRFRDPATCLIKLTSGTTGRPCPLVFTAAQMLADAQQVCRTMGIGVSDLNYAQIPFGHSYGLGNLVFPLLAHGVPVVCGAMPLPHAIAAEFAAWRPTVFPSVPAVWRALATADVDANAFASLRLAISAGAPLPPEVARAFEARFGKRLHAFYGSSETGGIAYDRSGTATLAGGVGRAMHGVRITSLRGQRIRVASAAVFTSGNRRRDAGQGAWVTADRVAIDRRGRLALLGRSGTIVKIGGRRVNLAEVSARLRRVAGVRDAWVAVSRATEPLLGAAIVSERSAEQVRAELLADTAAWKIPKRWAVLREFPLTARGKPDTRALEAAVFR